LVNNTRRLFPSFVQIKAIMDSRELGEPLSIDWAEGERFHWPTASGFYFNRPPTRGEDGHARGVLLDVGAHAVDALCWWLGVQSLESALVSCQGDSFGGPEATIDATFQFGACRAALRLSWLSTQRNSVRIQFERGLVEAGVWDWNDLTITRDGRTRRVK